MVKKIKARSEKVRRLQQQAREAVITGAKNQLPGFGYVALAFWNALKFYKYGFSYCDQYVQ